MPLFSCKKLSGFVMALEKAGDTMSKIELKAKDSVIVTTDFNGQQIESTGMFCGFTVEGLAIVSFIQCNGGVTKGEVPLNTVRLDK